MPSIQESVHSSDHALDGGKSTVASPFSRPRWQSQAWQQLHAQRSPARHRQGRPRAHPSRPRPTVLEYWLPVPRWCRSSRVTVQRPPRPHQTCTHDYWTNVVLDSDTMGKKPSGLQKTPNIRPGMIRELSAPPLLLLFSLLPPSLLTGSQEARNERRRSWLASLTRSVLTSRADRPLPHRTRTGPMPATPTTTTPRILSTTIPPSTSPVSTKSSLTARPPSPQSRPHPRPSCKSVTDWLDDDDDDDEEERVHAGSVLVPEAKRQSFRRTGVVRRLPPPCPLSTTTETGADSVASG